MKNIEIRSLSLKTRIGLCIAFLILLVIGILSAAAHHEFKESLLSHLDYRLRSDVDVIREILRTDHFHTEEAKREIQAILMLSRGTWRLGHRIWIEGDDSTEMQNNDLVDLAAFVKNPAEKPPDLDSFRFLNIDRGKIKGRLIWARCSIPGISPRENLIVNIAIAMSSAHAYHEIGEFARVLLITGGILFAVSIAMILGIFKWGFIPIGVLTERMNKISDKNLDSVSYEFPPMPRELLPFVKSWEEMIKKLAHAVNEQKRFTSDASHELRTPIALLKSTLQLAQAQERSPTFYKKMIDHALEDLERLNHLIQQMLTLTRLGISQPTWDRETIQMKDLMLDIAEQYTPFLEERGFHLVCSASPAVLQANPLQIRQLITNLIDNAAQYAPSQSTITVNMENDSNNLKITVHDTGGSIPPEECSLIFQRFYRVQKARDRHSGGAGLGLAIAREIAVLHGGDITVRSNLLEGTLFTIVLPLAKE